MAEACAVMIFSSRDDLTVMLADTYASCPYYQGTGKCSGGGCFVAGEPLCITNEPIDGWVSETFEPYNPPNPILVQFRSGQSYSAHYWAHRLAKTDLPVGIAGATSDHIDHARRVLTRLASFTERNNA